MVYDFEEELAPTWSSAWLVFHSTIADELGFGTYDSGFVSPLKFTVGNYVRVLDECTFNLETRLVNFLVVGERSGRHGRGPRQRLAMGQMIADFWEQLTPEKGMTIFLT